jgi:hypothetical protein
VTTTARVDLVAGFGTMMTAFIAANPTLLKRHFRVRPESVAGELPYSYLDLRPETAAYAVGVQTRTFSPTLVVVGPAVPNDQIVSVLDTLVDALVEYIGGYGGAFGGHITANTVWSSMTIADGIEQDGDSVFPAVRFSFPDLSISEGRT